MTKVQKKRIILVIILSLIGFISFSIFNKLSKLHSINWGKQEDYLWIFKDSVLNDIDENSFAVYNKRDIYIDFGYKAILKKQIQGYYVLLWEFKDLEKINIHYSKFTNSQESANLYIDKGEVIDQGSASEITIKEDYSFINEMNVDAYFGNIDTLFKQEKYVGFFGKTRKILFSNKDGENEIIINNETDNNLALLLLYKKNSNLYLILIRSNKYFDKDIIKILNLK